MLFCCLPDIYSGRTICVISWGGGTQYEPRCHLMGGGAPNMSQGVISWCGDHPIWAKVSSHGGGTRYDPMYSRYIGSCAPPPPILYLIITLIRSLQHLFYSICILPLPSFVWFWYFLMHYFYRISLFLTPLFINFLILLDQILTLSRAPRINW